MTENKDRESILKAVKERVKQSEELQITQMIVDAIGERRYRDLEDLVSQIEQDRGWTEVCKHLFKARNLPYTLPIGAGPNKTQIESLKYRESIFTLLGCDGFEPIPITIEEILDQIQNSESLIDASQSLLSECETIATKQIESGDTLFFILENADNSFSKNITDLLEQNQHNEISNLVLERSENTIDILPLWHSEKGRHTLSQLGIKGFTIDLEELSVVISVLQEELETIASSDQISQKVSLKTPSNPQYKSLLIAMINHDIEDLGEISSKYSYPTLNFILQNTIDQYEKEPTSDNFRRIISCVNTHVRVRTPESIMLLEELTHSKDTRIATTAITALGNFYSESAASALVDLLCKTKNREVTDTTVRAIKNVSNSCFEAKYIVKKAADSASCTNVGSLKRLYKEIWKEKYDYYL